MAEQGVVCSATSSQALLWPVEFAREESRGCLEDPVGPPELGRLTFEPYDTARSAMVSPGLLRSSISARRTHFAQCLRSAVPKLLLRRVLADYRVAMGGSGSSVAAAVAAISAGGAARLQ